MNRGSLWPYRCPTDCKYQASQAVMDSRITPFRKGGWGIFSGTSDLRDAGKQVFQVQQTLLPPGVAGHFLRVRVPAGINKLLGHLPG